MTFNKIKAAFLLVALMLGASASARTKVACVGNSITYGMTIDDRENNSYPSRLARMLGDEYEVGNFGKNGATLLAKGHRPYIQQDEYKAALEFAPDIVVIHLGVNDTDPRNFPDYGDFFVEDYVALIESFKQANPNVRVIVANLSPILSRHPRFKSGTRQWRDKIRQLIPAVAKATGAELIDFGEALRDRPDLITDGVHPNAQGAEILAETVRGAITGDYGGLKMPQIYGDGMVLQRYKPLKINGTANAADTVAISIAGNSAYAVADNRGHWSATLPPMREGKGYLMTVTDGKTTLTFNDVAIGEVWIASGQSNMAFTMAEALNDNRPTYNDSLLRFFDMKRVAHTNPGEWSDESKAKTDSLAHYLPARWQESSSETVDAFSAVGWHFGKTLRDSLNIPVGIISNAIGGSPTEAWIDIETLEHELPEILVDWRKNDFIQPWVRQRAVENATTDPSHRHPYEPSYLFASGIRPLASYPVAGVIWYQGESNAHNIEAHELLFPMLVESWRENWEQPAMPFLFVQLSSINRPSWPAFRDSQRRLADRIPGAAMAVSMDHGDSLDVHPRNKLIVGQRLARQALNRVYGMTNVVPEGPKILKAERTAPGTLLLTFDYGDGMKTSDSMPVRTFEMAETDGLYRPAQTVEILDNKTIKLVCADIENPKFVRYGWQPFTRANLVNGDNLPASTFKIAVTENESQHAEDGIECGVSAAYVGIAGGRLISAGGCNFPENPMAPGSPKKFYDGVYALIPDAGGSVITKQIGSLPAAMAYGAAVPTPEGLVLIGGTTGAESLASVFLLTVNGEGRSEIASLPSLPATVDNHAAAYLDGKIYVAGGNVDGQPSNTMYCLDMANTEKGWSALTPMPGNPRVQPVMAAAGGKLYVFGGFAGKAPGREASLETDGLAFNPKNKKWTKVAGPVDYDGNEVSTGGGIAATLPDGRIVVAGGVNKDVFLEALRCQAPDYLSHPADWYRFNDLVFLFDPATQKWSVARQDKSAARAGAGIAVTPEGEVIISGGEIKPRIRTANTLRIKP